MSKLMIKDELMTINEIVSYAKVSKSTIFRRIKDYKESKGRSGLGPPLPFSSNQLRFRLSDVNRWIDSHKVDL